MIITMAIAEQTGATNQISETTADVARGSEQIAHTITEVAASSGNSKRVKIFCVEL